MTDKDLRIVFMGTPEFAAKILETLVDNNYNIVGVVTAPDKPAGRGQKLSEPEVKKYAKEKNLKILQPEKLKDTEFIDTLKALKPDIQIVVAFRMLPEVVWQIPQKGTFNLHASLLPQYRGAAPINWAIINGEIQTGLTTFLIDKEIDTGKILLKKEIEISISETAGELHDRMIPIGTALIIETLKMLASDNYHAISQESLISDIQNLKPAPKLFKTDCRINWNENGWRIYNKIRGLSPFPCAWTELLHPDGTRPLVLKIYEIDWIFSEHLHKPGKILSSNSDLLVAVDEGFIIIKSLQLEGKKRLKTEEFLRGFKFDGHYVQ